MKTTILRYVAYCIIILGFSATAAVKDEFAGELTADIDHDNRVEMVRWWKHEAF